MFVNQRVLAWNSAAFGLMALLMATFGVYGVVSYSVAQRTHEYGVRVALGARSGDIARLVLRQVLVLSCIGVPLGVAFAAAGARIVSELPRRRQCCRPDIVRSVRRSDRRGYVLCRRTYLHAARCESIRWERYVTNSVNG